MHVTPKGTGRITVRTVKAAEALAKWYGKKYLRNDGFSVRLDPFVTLSNRASGGRRRPILVGPPTTLQAFAKSNALILNG